MKRYLIILITLLLAASSALAQRNSTLVGVVKDEQGIGLQGVVVYVKSAPSVGTQTDHYGNFELKSIPSDNFYINGKEYGNHQAMRGMAKADVKTGVAVKRRRRSRSNGMRPIHVATDRR